MPNRTFLPVLLVWAAAVPSLFASATDNPLLRLVPARVELVSGIAAPRSGQAAGRILAGTVGNNQDFDDCLALLGVDGGRSIEEVVEADASTASGDLSDHLLLLGGRFNEDAIYKAAIENGAARDEHEGIELLVIPPFQRSRRPTKDVRWLAVLNDSIVVYGVPAMVGDALARFARNAGIDPGLQRRVAQFRRDIDSWTRIAMPSPLLQLHLAFYMPATFLNTALTGVDELAVGIHYGRKDRVDFMIHRRVRYDPGERLFTRAQLVPASLTSVHGFQVARVPADQNSVRGSFTVRAAEFDRWLASVAQTPAPARVMQKKK